MLRVCVASFMTRMNPTVAETDDVKTAVSEAVTNSIVHGYPYEKGLIRLVCAIEKDTLTVQIRDWGRGIENVKTQQNNGANVENMGKEFEWKNGKCNIYAAGQLVCLMIMYAMELALAFWPQAHGFLLYGSIYG